MDNIEKQTHYNKWSLRTDLDIRKHIKLKKNKTLKPFFQLKNKFKSSLHFCNSLSQVLSFETSHLTFWNIGYEFIYSLIFKGYSLKKKNSS